MIRCSRPSPAARPLASRPRALLLAALSALTVTGCSNDAEPPDPWPTVRAEWDSAAADGLLEAFWSTPDAVQRLLAWPKVCLQGDDAVGVGFVRISRGGRDLTFYDSRELRTCVWLEVSDPPATEGTSFLVELGDWRGRRHVALALMPPFPAPPASAFYAHAALRMADGTTWLATPHDGLVGVTASGAVVHYLGVDSSAPWDPHAREPQSGLVLALAPAGPDALWVATATTGVSWFRPGRDPLSSTDDVWIHGQPSADPPLAAELSQTALAIAPEPADPDGLWVASLNGLYHARRGAEGIDFSRIADGPALAVTVDATGRVWAGFTTQARIEVPDDDDIAPGPSVPLAPALGALLVVEPGADPHDPAAAELRWALADEDAVTALLVDANAAAPPRGAWVGTPYGLAHVALGELTRDPVPAAEGLAQGDLAVVALAPTDGGFWIAARDECAADRGRLLRVETDAAGAIDSVQDYSDAGFGERDFAWVRELGPGELMVSTLVPRLALTTDPLTARGCEEPAPSDRTADLYLLTRDGKVRRFGAEP